MTEQKLVSWLFETKAVRVCPGDMPFWYTSGTIGPYYVNTHFLYGSEEKANELLKFIDEAKNDKLECPKSVLSAARENYNKDNIYRGLVDEMCSCIKENIDLGSVDYISGGERRDWFFSLLIADILGKPHITIYKDLTPVLLNNGKAEYIEDLKGGNVLHIADLITEASSYERAWIPAVEGLKGKIKWSLVVVDRKQGGEELLARHNVKSLSMVNIDGSLFENALGMGLINRVQYEMVLEYIKNPKDAMRRFLLEHPEFLKKSLNADEKTRERAKLCLEKNIYGMQPTYS